MVNLFVKERFIMHAGGISDFKIECDALTKEDYKTLAFLVSRKIDYKKVYGIPRGGIPFEQELKKYENKNSNVILIADDVLTTGTSMIDFKKDLLAKEDIKEEDIKGIVIFNRGNTLSWVETIFSLNEQFWQND